MGCDIHVFIEKRLRKSDPWELDEHHTIDEDGYMQKVSATSRNYTLFGILAGVRGGGCIYEQRGIPEDCSPKLKENALGPDWHSHSWLTLDEFDKCLHEAGFYKTTHKNDSKSTQAFYDWMNYDRNYRPADYITIVNYCNEWLNNEIAEAKLLNNDSVEPEVRLVFWFDN